MNCCFKATILNFSKKIMSTLTKKSLAIPVVQAEVSDRMAFIKKVYGLLGLSLLSGILASVYTLSNEGFLITVSQNYWVFYIAELGVLILCLWKRKAATLGLILLFTFTILSGITVSPLIYVYKPVAAQAALLTGVAFCGLTAYVFISKKDFSFLGGILWVGLVLMIVGGLLNVFLFKSFDLQYFMAWIGVFLFSGFILYDTSNIIRRYNTDEYIAGALSLYIDILQLFIHLLIILGGRRS